MPKEKPIIGNNANRLRVALSALSSEAAENPYTSERHKEAVRYIKDGKIGIPPLRGLNEE